MRFLSACLIAALFAASNATAAELAATVRKSEVSVYAAPNLESAKLKKLKQDDSVAIVAQQGLWYELKLPDGSSGFVRVNDVRVNYGNVEDSGANARVLTTGKAGAGRVSETAGVRGIDESELKAASFNQAQFDAMVANRADTSASAAYASGHGWQATAVAWDAESKPKKDEKASKSSSSGSSTLQGLSGMMGSLGQKASSILGTASKVAPKSEQEQAAEELALGPQIAGRVLGARPLWGDAEAQKRVNVVGRWVASQTSRPDLPWTFGVIDDAEINAYAAPGGYVLVTRGLYELLSSDAELAAVLGHEISHCRRARSLQRDPQAGDHHRRQGRRGRRDRRGHRRRGELREAVRREARRHDPADLARPAGGVPCGQGRGDLPRARGHESDGAVRRAAEDDGARQPVREPRVALQDAPAARCAPR